MTLLARVRRALPDSSRSTTAAAGSRVRCRNCGRYYAASATACPHCGSGNRLLGGPPDCDHDRA